jgi:hypothetical protein
MSVTFLGFHKGQQYSSRLRTRDLYKVSIVVGSLVLNTVSTLNTHDATDRSFQVIGYSTDVGCPRKVWWHCDPEIPKHASSLYRISARNRIWHITSGYDDGPWARTCFHGASCCYEEIREWHCPDPLVVTSHLAHWKYACWLWYRLQRSWPLNVRHNLEDRWWTRWITMDPEPSLGAHHWWLKRW